MTSLFKVYPVNNEDKPNIFELLFGKRKTSDIIKPVFMAGYDYKFLDKTQSLLFQAKFHEKSKTDGLPYFSYNRYADYSLASDVKYIRADNGTFSIRRIETITSNITT